MKDCNLAIVGFFGSGSSAITDLLKEYNNCYVALNENERGIERPYEHKLLYTKGGIFETADLFVNNNTPYCSDIFVNSFITNMERLYKNDFVSFGSYKKLLGKEFMDSVSTFCNDIGVVELKNGISRTEHKKTVRFSLIMAVLQIGARIVYHKPIYKLGKLNIMDKKPYYFAMPEKEVVQNAAKNFIERYFSMCRKGRKGVVLYDQLIHAQHVNKVDAFFNDNFRVIIIRRDPRDLFCLSKYVWSKPPHGFSAPLPTEVEEFCSFWRKMTNYNMTNTERILNISFEDLVYKYEETCLKIEEFLGIEKSNHIAKFEYFDPQKSIRNTQIFDRSNEMKKEAEKIASLLPDLIYDFPYSLDFKMNDIFEDTNETRKEKRSKD